MLCASNTICECCKQATGGVGEDHVQQLLLTLHSFHYVVFHRENKHSCLQHFCFFKLFSSCMQSTSYILVETVLRPAAPQRFHCYWDWCEEEIAGPPLAATASGSVAVATSKPLTESHQPLVSSKLTDFDNLSSTVGVASNPSFLSRVLSRTARFSLKLEDKIRDEKPGFEVMKVAACIHWHVSRLELAAVYCQRLEDNTQPSRLSSED